MSRWLTDEDRIRLGAEILGWLSGASAVHPADARRSVPPRIERAVEEIVDRHRAEATA